MGYSVAMKVFVQALRETAQAIKEETPVKRVLYLAAVALVAMLILVPTAMAQEATTKMDMTVQQETTQPLPKSGGPMVGAPTVLLPAAALLLGGGVLGYAVLRRR